MSKFDVYRDGRVHVAREMCSTCIFRPGNLMRLRAGRVRQMVDEAKRDESAIVCHQTLDGPSEVCRGFFDRFARDVTTLRFAMALGIIDGVDTTTTELE